MFQHTIGERTRIQDADEVFQDDLREVQEREVVLIPKRVYVG